MKETNTNHFSKVIRSCKTIEQIETCQQWIDNTKFKFKTDNIWAVMNAKLNLKGECLEMLKYLKKIKVLNELQ